MDRPASVLKELLDNSVDAGASQIKIILADGGLKSLEIEDNGSGMSREDLEICILRHATSKISALDDLDAIKSLGFRGEALAAISSVSKLKIESAQTGAEAWSLSTLGGSQQKIMPAPSRRGTRIQVDELFFNVPARKKFLKSLGSELNECVEVIHSMALAHPEISFEWHAIDHSSGEVKKSAQWRSGSMMDRFREVYGHEGEILFIDHTLPSAPEIKRAQIAIYRPPVSSAYQKTVRLAVNGRPVFDKRLPYALRESLAGLIEVSRYPILQANLDVDVHAVDVNIHPQKKEIRWPANFSLASYLYSVLRPQFEVKAPAFVAPLAEQMFADFSSPLNFAADSRPIPDSPEKNEGVTLNSFSLSTPSPQSSLGSPLVDSTSSAWNTSMIDSLAGSNLISSAIPSLGSPSTLMTAGSKHFLKAPKESSPPFRFSELRVIGESSAAWILCESIRGLVVIDQHAAHERVNFERILCSRQLLRAKPLLIPFPVPGGLEWEGLKTDFQKILEQFSFEFSDDGTQIIAVPEADRKINWGDLLNQVIEELRADSLVNNRVDLFKQQIAASLSCHGSVRRGQRLGNDSIKALLQSMDEVQWGGLCPHGRPVWIEISNPSIEESFHR